MEGQSFVSIFLRAYPFSASGLESSAGKNMAHIQFYKLSDRASTLGISQFRYKRLPWTASL